MTERNRELRDKVAQIENEALVCLHNQPLDDDDCERHLQKALAKIANLAGDFRGLVEVEAYDIDWDTDGEDVDLPDSVKIMMDNYDDIENDIADRLSDRFGWCVNSYNWRIV